MQVYIHIYPDQMETTIYTHSKNMYKDNTDVTKRTVTWPTFIIL